MESRVIRRLLFPMTGSSNIITAPELIIHLWEPVKWTAWEMLTLLGWETAHQAREVSSISHQQRKMLCFVPHLREAAWKSVMEKTVCILQKKADLKSWLNPCSRFPIMGNWHLNVGRTCIMSRKEQFSVLTEEGPVLIEVAKGVDLQKDILDQMEFVPKIAENLQYTPTELYFPEPFGLKSIIHKNKSGK